MSDYRDHAKYGFIALVILTVVILIIKHYGAITFLTADLTDSFTLFGVGIPIAVIAFALGMYATLLPDIDIGTSKIFHWTVAFLLIVCIMFILAGEYKYQTVAILLFIFGLLFLNHRGVTHSPWMGLLFAIIMGVAFSSTMVGLYVVVGYYAHLVADRR